MINYDLDDDDDDDDFLKVPGDTGNGTAMTANDRLTADVRNAVENGPGISPYARGGIVEKMIKDNAGLANREENLGDDFMETPWRIPSLDKANEYKVAQIYREGIANPYGLALTNAAELPVGVRLYFHFVKSIGVGLVIMSVLSLPLLAFAYYGTAIGAENQDTLGLYQYSLGNIGDYYPNMCHSGRMFLVTTTNETCINVAGIEFSSAEVSFVVTLCEFLQVIVMLAVIWHLRRRMWQYLHQRKSEEHVSITHYTVYVTNLPPYITEEEIIKHFSNLYQLEKVDWRNRPPVEDARPVNNCDNTGRMIHKDSWVAECTIYREIGKYLTNYKAKQDLLKSLYRNRAKMKMYAKDTAHSQGPSKKRYEKAEKAMLRVANQVDIFSNRMYHDYMKVIAKAKTRKEKAHKQYLKSIGHLKENKPSDDPKPAQIVAAVVPMTMPNVVNTTAVKNHSSGFFSCFNKKKNVEEKVLDNDIHNEEIEVLDKEKQPIGQDGENSQDIVGTGGGDIKEVAILSKIEPPHPPLKVEDVEEEKLIITVETGTKDGVKSVERAEGEVDEAVGNGNAVGPTGESETKEVAAEKDIENKMEEKANEQLNIVNDAAIVGAFVCFEYNESFARCLEDYSRYSRFPFNLLYPKELKLNGHRLHISRALEPDQIIYENLEKSEFWRSCLKFRTAIVTAMLMFVSFLMILAASISKTLYTDEIPTDSLCRDVIPAIYAGTNYFDDTDYIRTMKIVRPPKTTLDVVDDTNGNEGNGTVSSLFEGDYTVDFTRRSSHLRWRYPYDGAYASDKIEDNTIANLITILFNNSTDDAPSVEETSTSTLREAYDANCSVLIPNSFYAIYTVNGNFYQAATNYSFSACGNATSTKSSINSWDMDNYCPMYDQTSFCPCITMEVDQTCSSLSCQRSLDPETTLTNVATYSTRECKDSDGSYDAQSIVKCYCKQNIYELLTTANLITYAKAFLASMRPPDPKELGGDDAEYCGAFQGVYLSSYLLSYAAVLITVIINRILKIVLVHLTQYEAHKSLDDEQYSILLKLFITTYVNMAIIVLLAFGISVDLEEMPPKVGFGMYTDFKRTWFSHIGFYLITTFFISAFIPPVERWIKFRCGRPCMKMYAHHLIE